MNNFVTRKPLLLSLSVAMLASPSWAEDSSDETGDLTDVVVWGTAVSASSLKLEQEDIMIRQVDHLSDLLRTIPGVDVGGAHSLNQRITIRSMDDKDIAITIDGANQNTYMYHHMGNLQIHSDILQSVDIAVGNNSVVNGNLGGAVRFETRDAKDLLMDEDQFGGRVQASVASNGSDHYSLTGFGQITDSFDVLAYYNYVDRDNFKVGGGQILDGEGNFIEGTDGTVRGLAGELTDALLKVGWDITDNQRIKLGYETYTDEGDYSYRPDMGLATDIAIADALNISLTYPTKFTRDTLTLNYDLEWSDHTTVKAAVFNNESTLWRDETGLESWRPAFATINEGEANNTGYNLLANTELEWGAKHSLTYGFDVVDYKTHYSVDGAELSGEKSANAGAFIEDSIEFSSGFAVVPGARYDNVNVETAVADDTYDNVSYALALEYEANDNLLLRASATELFKAPWLSEVFTGAGLGKIPNYNINAQTGVNAELSIAYQGDLVSSGLTLFNTNIESFIYEYAPNPPVPDAGPRDTWVDNVGDMGITGFEAYVEYSDSNLGVLLTYSSSESELDANARYSSLDGARLDREQGDTISLNVDYDFSEVPVRLHWDVISVGAISADLGLDSAGIDNSKDSSVVHNVSAMWLPEGAWQGLSLTLGIDNLFDEYYASQSSRTGQSGHPLFGDLYLTDYEPGRNVKGTISYQF